ncbi:MAG: hypothetical protein KTR24_05315 [Saprospiraceae bacterium]|nr:hypothetical protein [Saprospiraceae bacterium]
MKQPILSFAFLLVAALPLFAQALQAPDLAEGLRYRSIGPANQGGRIVDVEAHDSDFTKVVLATGSGGVWKSLNAGTTWKPIFDRYETASIGDIALDQNQPEVIWVGTGEANNRNSVSWGNGIYKSTDGGESFSNMGLESTHHIARILVDPVNSDEVCVCAQGHLWGYSGDRGLFKTTDGGESWQKLTNGLPNDGKTGCTDLVQNRLNPNILYAAFYHRLRQPWTFHSGGGQGGIYKSVDGGDSWNKLTDGLPLGETGRIGLDIHRGDPNILVALIEADQSDTLSKLGSGIYRSEDGGERWSYVNTYNNRPFYYSQIRINPVDDQRVYVLTTTLMVSDDGGKTLRNGSPDYEVHGDYHAMWIDPNYPDRYYLGADKGFSITHDHGERFMLIDNLPIAQYYRIGYDMREPYYVYGGLQDNGSYATASFSRDARGILNDSNWKMHWGDGQDAISNPFDWTDMYTSMENGTFLKYNPQDRAIKRISPSALNTINFWDFFDPETEDWESSFRWNWSSPMVMSPHNPSTIFVGGNHLFRSRNKGKSWKVISPDLSTNDEIKRLANQSGGITPDNTGAETHCAISTVSISPIDEDVIWVGTDDGNIQVTQDGGASWTNVRTHLTDVPEGIWVSRVEASHFHLGRAFVTFDGHRSDLFEPMIFSTSDYGQHWDKIVEGLPVNESIRVIREDPVNEDLLFSGSETGVWYSLSQGEAWHSLKLNMPTVSIYDLKIHPRENDLIVGTHGRSIYILDDISPLQQWNSDIQSSGIQLFGQKETTLWKNTSRGGQRGHFWFAGENPEGFVNSSSIPRAAIDNHVLISYLVSEQQDSLDMTIQSLSGDQSVTIKVPGSKGLHRISWNRIFPSAKMSKEDRKELVTLMKRFAESIGHRRVQAAFELVQQSEDEVLIRRRLESLAGGYTSLDIPQKFLVQKAGPGTYQIQLAGEKSVQTSSLDIRDDPGF